MFHIFHIFCPNASLISLNIFLRMNQHIKFFFDNFVKIINFFHWCISSNSKWLSFHKRQLVWFWLILTWRYILIKIKIQISVISNNNWPLLSYCLQGSLFCSSSCNYCTIFDYIFILFIIFSYFFPTYNFFSIRFND